MRTSRQIIVAGASSRLASAMQSTALMIFAIGHSGSVQLAALVGLVSVLPTVLLSGLCTRAFRLLKARRVVAFALTASLAHASMPTEARLLVCLFLWGVCMFLMLLERPAFARVYH